MPGRRPGFRGPADPCALAHVTAIELGEIGPLLEEARGPAYQPPFVAKAARRTAQGPSLLDQRTCDLPKRRPQEDTCCYEPRNNNCRGNEEHSNPNHPTDSSTASMPPVARQSADFDKVTTAIRAMHSNFS
jgi:hypothetical protein